MNSIVAIPSCAPGGINAEISQHFGHCEAFTLVTFREGEVVETSVVPNVSHEHGGCMVPVRLLASHGATAIIAGGMGQRPLLGFLEVGIRPFFAGECRTVAEAAAAFSAGSLVPFVPSQTCGGDHHHDRAHA